MCKDIFPRCVGTLCVLGALWWHDTLAALGRLWVPHLPLQGTHRLLGAPRCLKSSSAKPGKAALPFPGTIQGPMLTKRWLSVSPIYSLPRWKQQLQVARNTGRYSEVVEIPTKFSPGIVFQSEVGLSSHGNAAITRGHCTTQLRSSGRFFTASISCSAAPGLNSPQNPKPPPPSSQPADAYFFSPNWPSSKNSAVWNQLPFKRRIWSPTSAQTLPKNLTRNMWNVGRSWNHPAADGV